MEAVRADVRRGVFSHRRGGGGRDVALAGLAALLFGPLDLLQEILAISVEVFVGPDDDVAVDFQSRGREAV